MSKVNPVPAVTVTDLGVDRVFTPVAPTSPAPAPGSPPVTVLDDIRITWGRGSYLDHQDPQTAKISFIQTVSDGTQPNWQNNPVRVSWTDPVSGTTKVIFRGRIVNVTMRLRRWEDRGGLRQRRPGLYIDVTAVGQLAELGNRRTGKESWPDESGDARMNRLRTLAGSTVAGIDYRAYFGGAPIAARSVDNLDCLSLLKSMFDTAGGDRMVYDPDSNRVSFVRRRSVQPISTEVTNWKARLRNDPTKYTAGVHAMAHTNGVTSATAIRWPQLDAQWIEGGDELVRTMDGGVTRLVYHWTVNGASSDGVIVDSATEASRGVVAADLSTELRQQDWAQTAGSDWLSIMWSEGARFQPSAMTYRADRAGGFDTLALAVLLIGATEARDPASQELQASANLCFIAGTGWSDVGIDPVVAVIGGEVRYVDGGWRPSFTVQRVNFEGTMRPPLAAQDAKANSTQDAIPLNTLSKALTCNDFRHINGYT